MAKNFSRFAPISATALFITLCIPYAMASDDALSLDTFANKMWVIHLKHEFPDYEGVTVRYGDEYMLLYRNSAADNVWCRVLSKKVKSEQIGKNLFLTVREVIRSEKGSCAERFPVGMISRTLYRFITKDLFQFTFLTEEQLAAGNLEKLSFNRQWYAFLCSEDITRKPGDCDASLPKDIWPDGFPNTPFEAAKDIVNEW